MRLALPIFAASLLAGCSSAPTLPADEGDVAVPIADAAAMLAELQPVELRVHALTRLERGPVNAASGSGAAGPSGSSEAANRSATAGSGQRLSVHLELLDKFGQGVKGLGRAVVVLHPRRAGVPEALLSGVGNAVGGVGSAVGGVVSGVTGIGRPEGYAAAVEANAVASAETSAIPPGSLRYIRDLTQPQANADAFDWITRCYVVPCGDLTPEMLEAATRGDVRIDATFSVLQPDGSRKLLSATFVLPAAK